MKELDDYFEAERKVHEYFGYKEEWHEYPLNDETEMYWFLEDKTVFMSYKNPNKTLEELQEEFEKLSKENDWNCYFGEFLQEDKGFEYSFCVMGGIYKKEDYTMMCVDTQTDGNKYLSIFDNKKELK